MSEHRRTTGRARARVRERYDAIVGAIQRNLLSLPSFAAMDACDIALRPVGEWVDVSRGSHELWAAAHAALAVRVAAGWRDEERRPSEAEIAATFGVTTGAMRRRTAELERAHVGDLVAAGYALRSLCDKRWPSPSDILKRLEELPTTEEQWPWLQDTYEDGEFTAGESPAIHAYYGALDLLDRDPHPYSAHKVLMEVIALDPDHYDSYLVLRDALAEDGRRQLGLRFEDLAYRRCLVRITMPDGGWPERMTYDKLENRPILRTLISKASTFWRQNRTVEALDILRRMLRMDVGDRSDAAGHILGIRLGMSYTQFERLCYGEGTDALAVGRWFADNHRLFPEDFSDWKARAAELYPNDDGSDDVFDGVEEEFHPSAETVN